MREQGQTLALVAVSIVSFLAMAALAIDLASLYSAKGEIQRAADASALAGAKAFVDSGVTTDPSNSTLQNIAQTMAQNYVAGAAAQNPVAGGSVTLAGGSPVIDFTLAGNPRVTVTLQRTGLPLFFARIWGNTVASVSATAVAEAYNPAYSNTSSFVPSAPKCVKPFLIPNDVPNASPSTHFVDPTTGSINTAAGQFIGQQITFQTACKKAGGGKKKAACNLSWPVQSGRYIPLLVGSSHQYCPSATAPGCSGSSASDFQQSIECCDGAAFNFRQCGSSGTFASWDPSTDPSAVGKPVLSGLQCLIHTTGASSQQDSLDPSAFASGTGPLLITPGGFSQSRYGVPSTAVMGTSDSIITVPLFENSGMAPANDQVTVVGFLTLFVENTTGNGKGNAGFIATITNVSGCGNSAVTGAAVSGGGVSSIPVRLVHN